MTSLFVHAAVGALMIGVFFFVNAPLYRRDWAGSRPTLLEGPYYALAVASVCAGWYFNVQYVSAYPTEQSWVHFTMSLFTSFGFAMGLYLAVQERQVRRLASTA